MAVVGQEANMLPRAISVRLRENTVEMRGLIQQVVIQEKVVVHATKVTLLVKNATMVIGYTLIVVLVQTVVHHQNPINLIFVAGQDETMKDLANNQIKYMSVKTYVLFH